jgi:hypothetical protein
MFRGAGSILNLEPPNIDPEPTKTGRSGEKIDILIEISEESEPCLSRAWKDIGDCWARVLDRQSTFPREPRVQDVLRAWVSHRGLTLYNCPDRVGRGTESFVPGGRVNTRGPAPGRISEHLMGEKDKACLLVHNQPCPGFFKSVALGISQQTYPRDDELLKAISEDLLKVVADLESEKKG